MIINSPFQNVMHSGDFAVWATEYVNNVTYFAENNCICIRFWNQKKKKSLKIYINKKKLQKCCNCYFYLKSEPLISCVHYYILLINMVKNMKKLGYTNTHSTCLWIMQWVNTNLKTELLQTSKDFLLELLQYLVDCPKFC